MTLFIIFHILVCTFLVFVILLQPGKADAGIGFGSSSQSIFGSKGASNFLTKTTSICAVVFLFTSFILTRSRIQEYEKSVIGKEPVAPAQSPMQNETVPVKPGAPTTPGAAAAAPQGNATTAPAPETEQKGVPPGTKEIPKPVNPTK